MPAVFVLVLVIFYFAATQTTRAEYVFQTLYEFPSSGIGPKIPSCRLVEGKDGSFYGTSSRGGTNGLGAIFKVTPNGVLTTLLSFDGTNGSRPSGGLLLASDGCFYGTTQEGGTNYPMSSGDGTIFKMTTNGVVIRLFSFNDIYNKSGYSPNGPLAQGSDGNFYGTTEQGGTNGLGTVFGITPNGTLASLFSFNGANGSSPIVGPTSGSDGNLYGTTWIGGVGYTGGFSGNGTVFKITTNGEVSTLIYFNGTNGQRPFSALTLGSNGNFYGTFSLGANCPAAMFELRTNADLTTLACFFAATNSTNVVVPLGGVTLGSDGAFYGTTVYTTDGTNLSYGTVYKVTTNGLLTTLVYLNGTNGSHPINGMVLGSDGNLYGAMADALVNLSINAGTIYRLVQPPVVNSIILTNGSVALTWTSFTNGIYRVEHKPALNATDWTALVPDVTATNTTASFADAAVGDLEHYYRVRLLP